MRFRYVVALALPLSLVLEAAGVGAAEITCLRRYGDNPGGAKAIKAAWPSGFRPSDNTCSWALIRGPIETGDHERFLAFYRQHHPGLASLDLLSPGGKVDEAIKMGRVVRKYLISVRAPMYSGLDRKMFLGRICDGTPDCVCASACALIWLGAVVRDGRVGLHRPRFTDPAFSALPPDAASKAYRQARNRRCPVAGGRVEGERQCL